MSEYIKSKTKMKDRKALIEALVCMGLTEKQIEIHEKGAHLYGYQGDQRDEIAHVIIRRGNVGGSSNDIGFHREKDGTYTPVISAFDKNSGGKFAKHTGGYNTAWENDLKQKYAVCLGTRVAKQKGFTVKTKVVGKTIELILER